MSKDLAFVLRFVVEGQGLGSAFDAEHCSRITGVGLEMSASIDFVSSGIALTTQILSFETMPTEAVQPETSSSYRVSEVGQLKLAA